MMFQTEAAFLTSLALLLERIGTKYNDDENFLAALEKWQEEISRRYAEECSRRIREDRIQIRNYSHAFGRTNVGPQYVMKVD
jgi:hypothetical protein